MTNAPTALVTGASRGIGFAIALRLAQEGFNIAGVSRRLKDEKRSQNLIDLENRIAKAKSAFLAIAADIGDASQHAAIIEAVINRFGRIDMLVNNAGIAPVERLDMLDMTIESYDRVMAVNLRGTFFLTQAVANRMIGTAQVPVNRSPKIVFITSLSAEIPSTDRAEYCMSKAGLSMAARLFADRLAGVGIGVYEIRPGIIDTDMTRPQRTKYDEKIAAGLIPQQRWGKPDDVARVVAALARGDFDYSTGSVFEVSGGMNIRRL